MLGAFSIFLNHICLFLQADNTFAIFFLLYSPNIVCVCVSVCVYEYTYRISIE